MAKTVAMLLFTLCGGALPALAHDIPNDVSIQTFFKPSGQHAELLMRVPLKAMRDVVFPEKSGTGYIDIEKSEALLAGASQLWLSDFIDLYEDDAKLPKPRVAATILSLESDRSFADFETARAHKVIGPKLPQENQRRLEPDVS